MHVELLIKITFLKSVNNRLYWFINVLNVQGIIAYQTEN